MAIAISSLLHFNTLYSQLPIVLMGFVGSFPDGYAFVAVETIPAGTQIYFTDAAYISGMNSFGTQEGTWSWTAPSGGVPAGEVITFAEDSQNVLTVDCSTLANCGTYILHFGIISFGVGGTLPESVAAYTDTDDDKSNGIAEIYGVIYSDGTIPSGQDPRTDFPQSIVVDGFTGPIGHREYIPALRSSTVTQVDLQNPANYIQLQEQVLT